MDTEITTPVCAVCSRVLNTLKNRTNGEIRYVHASLREDHAPVPVNSDQVVSVEVHCDFCYTTPAPWLFPTSEFQDPIGSISSPGYAACQQCHDLVMAEDRYGLLDAAVQGAVRSIPELKSDDAALRHLIGLMVDSFRVHRTGPPTRTD